MWLACSQGPLHLDWLSFSRKSSNAFIQVHSESKHTNIPFEHHRHILRAGDPTDLIGDLLAQSLLQLQAMRKLVRNPREFREAQHFCVGDVADGDITPE